MTYTQSPSTIKLLEDALKLALAIILRYLLIDMNASFL